MKHARARWAGAVIGLLCLVVAFWQWQALARLAVIAGADAMLHVRVSVERSAIVLNQATFENVSVVSLRDEPIARIRRLSLAYDLRDLLGGKRLFGLKSVDVDQPAVTIIRRLDGTYNVPIPNLQSAPAGRQPPLTLRARVGGGSIEVIDERRFALPAEGRFYVENLQADADLSAPGAARYAVDLRYGERSNALYPVRGRGEIDARDGYADERWTAEELPIAAAVDFILDSPALQLERGTLHNVDLRYFGLTNTNGPLRPHLTGGAFLDRARIAISGLSVPVEDVHGRVDVYDAGFLTPALEARVAGVAALVSGGIYGLRDPQARITVRGATDLAELRSVFAQAKHLPMRGPIRFAMLAEGKASNPTIWIRLRSPEVTYAAASVDRVDGLIALRGREANVIRLAGAYQQADVIARGRLAFDKERNAIEAVVRAQSPPGGIPYASRLLPELPLNSIALATADDPKAISVRGTLWGNSRAESARAIFDIDSRGTGTIGPIDVRSDGGSLYARVALDQPHRSSFGLLEANAFPLAPAKAILDASIFGAQGPRGIEGSANARLHGGFGTVRAQGNLSMAGGALRGAVFGDDGNEASFAATIAGRPQSPRIAGTVVVAGGRYRNFDVNGAAGLEFHNGTLRIADAAVAVGPLFLGLSGTINGVSRHGALAPRYDLAAELHSSDVSALLAAVQPRAAQLVQGSLDAEVRVRGSGMTPSVAGSMSAPEGSVNGLSFRDLQGEVSGTSSAISLAGAHVIVGSSAIAFSGSATPGSADVSVSAPRIDLADFNDFFDSGDTFAGTGSLAFRADVAGKQIVATSGAADFSGARLRRISVGSVTARWRSAEGSIASSLRFGGPAGEIALAGTVAPATRTVDVHASAHSVDLNTWLPMLGLAYPVTGRLDAATNLKGTYPNLAMHVDAAVYGATVGRIPIERFNLRASASNGLGRVESAVLDTPSLTNSASGTFGLRPNAPLALVIQSGSPDVGDLLQRLTGKETGLRGSFDSTLRVEGTLDRPRLRDVIAVRSLQHGNVTIPRIAGEIDADTNTVTLRNGEVDLTRGRLLLAATAPIQIGRAGLAPASGPISGALTVQDLELSSLAGLLPTGTRLEGRIDGGVRVGGTVRSPQLEGALALRDGIFNGPMERSPISGIAADLSLTGSSVRMQSHAFVGGGAITARASASLADLHRPADATFTVDAAADNARFDLPGYFQGNINGTIAVARVRSSAPSISGDLSIYNARIPIDAFLRQKAGGQAAAFPIAAFDGLRVAAGQNVRVQSANVDIGTSGAVRLGGTLDAPTLAGAFHSTGGSLSFYRNFSLQSGIVRFDPSSGVIPDVDAVATTFVSDPATAIELHATGPATEMNLALASDPPYSREQILGLLLGAQQFGAVQGVQSTGGSPSAGSAAQNVAFGQLNTIFTRNLLEPLNASLGSALGFTEVQITSDVQTGLGLNAMKAFGKYVNAIWAESFGYPKTQSVALEAHPNVATGLRLTAYSSQGPTLFALQQPQPLAFGVLNLNPLTSFTPITGSNGVSFSYQRKFP
jgi:autotransporter translocation and assembly factor TamB